MYILVLHLFLMCFLFCYLLIPSFLSSYTFTLIYISKSSTSMLNLLTFFLCFSAYLCLCLSFSLLVSVTPCPSFFLGKIVLRCFQLLYYNNFMYPSSQKKKNTKLWNSILKCLRIASFYILRCHNLHTPRRRRWQPTPVLLPGKSRGRRSLAGCSPWGRQESDTPEVI